MLSGSQNNSSFRVLFKSLYPQLCVLAYRYLNDLELSKDLVQGVFLKVWEDNVPFVNENHITGYFYKTVKDTCMEYLKSKNHKGAGVEPTDAEALFMSEAVVIETTAVIENALKTLPDKEAEVMRLSIEDYTNNEIAEQLAVSVHTVKDYKKAAQLKLGKLLSFLTVR